jgi:hypothetical protein
LFTCEGASERETFSRSARSAEPKPNEGALALVESRCLPNAVPATSRFPAHELDIAPASGGLVEFPYLPMYHPVLTLCNDV